MSFRCTQVRELFVRIFVGLIIGANAPQLISFVTPVIAALFVTALIILAATRCFHALFGILLGLILTSADIGKHVTGQVRADYVGDSLIAVCTVADFPVSGESSIRFDAHCSAAVETPRRVRLSWRNPPVRIYLGDRWQFEVRLRRPSGLSNPGGFDIEKAFAVTGRGATGYVVESKRNRLLGSAGTALDRFRKRAVERTVEQLPDRDSAAIIVALAVGSRHLMSDDQWQRYSASGTTHLVAISGLHIGLVAAIGGLLGRLIAGLLRVRRNQRRLAMIAAVLSAVAYTAMSGFGIPAQRACLMLLMALTAWFFSRESDGVRILAVAGVLIVLSNPLAVLSAGFNLSFMAVLALIWVARSRHEHLDNGRFGLLFHRGMQLASVQVALFAGLTAVSAAHFGRFSLSAPFLNLVAVPLFSLVTVPVTLLSLAIPGLDRFGLPIAALSVEWLDAMANRTAVTAPVSLLDIATVLASVGVGTWLLLPRGIPGRVLAPACLLPLLMPADHRPDEGCVRAAFLDVGQGTAILVETADHRLLYDTGPAYLGGGSAAETAILPYFRSHGIDRLDRLIVSHADLDHAGGLATLLATLPVERIFVGEAVAGVDWTFCRNDQAWIWDGIRFEFLLPHAVARGTGNNASCVLRISTGEQTILLTGDMEATAERRLLAQQIGAVTLISVPHHGSRTSSTPSLVDALDPSYAVVSAGHENRWDLPHPRIVQRWQDNGAIVLNTATEGAISFEVCRDERPALETRHRRDSQMRWHRRLPPDPAGRTENF